MRNFSKEEMIQSFMDRNMFCGYGTEYRKGGLKQ